MIESQANPIRRLFDAVVELPAEQRLPYLEAHCSDEVIRRRVQDLLDVQDSQATKTGLATLPQSVASRELPTIPGYEIVGKLGEGGMGIVFKARDPKLGRIVAIKMLRTNQETTPEQLRRFHREAQSVAQLHHPNLIQIFEVGVVDGNPFLVLEYIGGGSLVKKLQPGAFTFRQIAAFLSTLAKAMEHAHQRGIVHRDLKPANILLNEDGTPKIGDFGLAKRLGQHDESLTQTGAVMGTPSYMAPEQAGDVEQTGPRTDVYGLGGILYHLLTGRPPHQGPDALHILQKVLHEEVALPSRIRPGVPRDLETICLKSLAKDANHRYPSAAEFADDLDRYLADQPIRARRLPWTERMRRFLKRRPLVTSLCAVLFAAVLAAGWLLVRDQDRQNTSALLGEFDRGLRTEPWTLAKRDQLEAVVQELASRSPQEADNARRRLIELCAQRFRGELQESLFQENRIQRLQEELAWFQSRDSPLAEELRTAYSQRLREWQPLASVEAPFENWPAVFPEATFIKGNEGLRIQPKYLGAPPFATHVGSRNDIQVEAVFSPSWMESQQIAVWFHHYVDAVHAWPLGEPREISIEKDPEKSKNGLQRGYAVRLASLGNVDLPTNENAVFASDWKPSGTFEASGGKARFQVLRHGMVLREKIVALDKGPLHLVARCEGDHLTCHVNGKETLEFFDLIPPGDTIRGKIALAMAKPTVLTSFRVSTLPLPQAPSPLELADLHMAKGNFLEALALYKQGANASQGSRNLEARCKAGICCFRLQRKDECAALFEPILLEKNERWKVVAGILLMTLRLEQNRLEDAEFLLGILAANQALSSIPAYIPLETQRTLLQNKFRPRDLIWTDQEQVRRFELTMRLAEQLDERSYFGHAYALVRLYALTGQEEKAFQLADKMMPWVRRRAVQVLLGGEEPNWMGRWHCWLATRLGEPGRAMDHLNHMVQRFPKEFDLGIPDAWGVAKEVACLPSLLYRARLFVFLKKPQAAEKDLDEFFAGAIPHSQLFENQAAAALLKGFLQEDRGRGDDAKKTWAASTLAVYQAKIPSQKIYLGMHGTLYDWILGSLSRTMTDAEAVAMWKEVLSQLGSGDVWLNQLSNYVTPTPSVIREAWQTPRGTKLAKQIACHDLAPPDFYRFPIYLLAYEKIRQEVFLKKWTSDQEAFVWETIGMFAEHSFSGSNKSHLLQMGLAWKGTAGFLGWGGLAPQLPKELRCRVGYLLGHRYLRLNRPDDALTFFRDARNDAPPDSPLRKWIDSDGRLTK